MKIKLPNGETFYYKPCSLYLGRKKINIEIEKENLKIFKDFCIENNLSFCLLYGTLLGAIREKGFIKHDEDIDIALKYNLFNSFLTALPKLKAYGFKLARIDERGFASVIRNNEYIDLYFFNPKNDKISECCGNFVFNKYLDNLSDYDLYGETYKIPQQAEEYLRFEYGENWKTPIEYKQSLFYQFISILRQKIKGIMPRKIRNQILEKKSSRNFIVFEEKINKIK